jgi:branched-chain amino acid aminotransferase
MAERPPEYLLLNGEIVPFAEAKVHPLTPAFKFGASVFEGVRAYWNDAEEQLYIFRLDAHTRRLHQSMKIMRMEMSELVQHLNQQTIELLKKNGFREDCHIRQIVFVDIVKRSGLTEKGPVGTFVSPYPHRSILSPEGIHCCVSSWRRITDGTIPPRIKCGANYQNARLALLQAQADGYDGAIMLNEAGKVSEDPRACFFMVRDGVPITPPVTSNILESITRDTLIQLFKEVHDVKVEVRDIDRTELYIADEAFLCGSGTEVSPIASIDRHKLGEGVPGPLTGKIRSTYLQVVRGELPLHPEWRTPVY